MESQELIINGTIGEPKMFKQFKGDDKDAKSNIRAVDAEK